MRRVALVGTLGAGEAESIIGVGRYAVPPTQPDPPRSAELAFLIRDEHQGRGIGTVLLAHLLVIAGEQGIRAFEADVPAENRAMLRVFEKSGLRARRSLESGVVHLSFPTKDPVNVEKKE